MANETKGDTIRLGQEVFVVSDNQGLVERTVVARIGLHDYTFLNGVSGTEKHFADFADAAAEADSALAFLEAQLKKRLKEVRAKRRSIGSPEHKLAVLKAKLKICDLRQVDDPDRIRRLKNVTVPESYFLPGDTVYVAVVPWTRSRGEFKHQPYQYFVLETVVTSVCFTGRGKAYYTFSTPFEVDECFATIEEAHAHLQTLCVTGPVTNVMFVPHSEERAELARMEEEAGPPF